MSSSTQWSKDHEGQRVAHKFLWWKQFWWLWMWMWMWTWTWWCCGGCGGDRTKNWGQWCATKGDPANPSTNTSLGGVKNRDGKWMMNCKLGGWNETHTTGFHFKWNQNQSTLCIPSTHIFWAKSGTTPSAEKVPTPAVAGTASSGVSRGQLSGLINQYKTESDDGMFLSNLSEFEFLLN